MAHNKRIIPCFTKKDYQDANYQIVENQDGTVSVFDNNGNPRTDHETKSCCEALGYNFNLDLQKCMWGNLDGDNDGDGTVIGESCVFKPFKVILNPEGNGSTLFDLDDNETCCLDISFDYLFNFDCDVLETFIKENSESEEPTKSELMRLSLENEISDKESECGRINDLVEFEESQDVPFVIECGENKYCLTDDGLVGWNKTIGSSRYNQWLASSGSDINLYSCVDVNRFLNSAPNGDVWFTSNCGFSIYDKLESDRKLNKLRVESDECSKELEALNIKLMSVEDVINDTVGCDNYIDLFESLDIRFNLEKLNQSTGRLETVYQETIFNVPEGSLSDYIVNNHGSTGLLIEGGCNHMRPTIQKELLEQYQGIHGDVPKHVYTIFKDWFDTCWLRYEREICDPAVIDALTDENINISLTVKNSCIDFSILLDRVKIEKKCEKVENVKTFISEPPKFEFNKVLDNKKSWLANKDKEERDFDLKYRNTEYFSNEQRLTINSKEIDLNLSPARAVEQDVWCFISDNNCILESCNEIGVFEPYSCPTGFDFDNNVTTCIMSAVTSTIKVGNIYTASTAYNFNRVNHYGLRGTIFIEDEVTDLAWPIFWTGTPVNTWVGPYYNVDYLTDSTGTTINATGFGTQYKQGGMLRWSSPKAFSGYWSEFGSSESLTVNGKPNPNLLWGGTPGLNSMVMAGRLFNASIWVSGTGVNNQFFENRWVGVSECLILEETQIYSIGFAADDKVRVKVNGEWLVNPDISPDRVIGVDSGFDTFRPNTRFTQAYVVAPIRLFKGKNVIEVEGFNGTAGAPAGFVCEVYTATTTELKAMTGETELDVATIFSTKQYIGEELNVVGNEGYFCPVNYALDTCLPEPFQCLQLTRVDSIEAEIESCCCGDEVLIVEDYAGIKVQLPGPTSASTIGDCEDAVTAFTTFADNYISGGSQFDFTIPSECSPVYSVNDGELEPNPDGGLAYWLALENDGTVGLYEAEYTDTTSGGTTTITNKTGLITADCCSAFDDEFKKIETFAKEGSDVFADLSWDKNLKKCVYQRCGGDACIDVDALLTTEITEFDTVEEFTTTLTSELIDVKNRQTISSYPTLKMLYERYNNHALDFCGVNSSRFDYFDMDNFGKTVGDYWVDLIEQVIPATTLWSSTYEYRNTVFDQQKFPYKRTSIFTCVDPSGDFPMNPVSSDNNVEVILETLPNGSTEVSSVEECQGVWVIQNTCGTEYLGTVSILGKGGSEVAQISSKTISEISTLDN